jgi:hypothetical protein
VSDKSTYTSDEWSLLRSTPTFVSAGVAAADPGGVVGAIKEATAGAQAFAEFAVKHSTLDLFKALASDQSLPAMPSPQELMGTGDAQQQTLNFQHAVLGRVSDTVKVLEAKAAPEETAAYKELLSYVADKVANASSEGGFLGFGGVRVSDKEKSFLAALAGAMEHTLPEASAAAPATAPAGSAPA